VFKNGEELLFNVQGGAQGTRVEGTSGLPEFATGLEGWFRKEKHLMTPTHNPMAYDVLVKKVWKGETSSFVGTDTLMASWRLWTPLLHQLDDMEEAPTTYTTGGSVMYDTIKSKFGVLTGKLVEEKSSDL
jgi:hypothetical protein